MGPAAVLVMTLMLLQGMALALPIPDQLEPGATRLFIYPEFGGSQFISVSVPTEGVVVDANLTLTGSSRAYPAVNMDYGIEEGDEKDSGWYGNTAKKPPEGGPKTVKKFTAARSDLNNLSSSDNKRWSTTFHSPWSKDLGGNTIAEFPYHHIQFDISSSKNTIDSISVTWEGAGSISSAVFTYGAGLYIWDPADSEWVKLDSYSNTVGDVTLTGTFSPGNEDMSKYGSVVNVLAVGIWNQLASWVKLESDYVAITVRSHTVASPTDVSVDVRDDGDIEHDYKGILSGSVHFGRDEGFVAALQSAIDDYQPGDETVNGNILVPINISSTTGGTLGVTVDVIDVDTPPVQEREISDIVIYEDGMMEAPDNLTKYFLDDHDAINLTYSVSYLERPEKVRVWVAAGYDLSAEAIAADWSGTSKFRVTAADRFGQAVESKNVTVEVRPVNDGPVIDDPGPLTAYENRVFEATITATDADPDDTLTFGDDTGLFDIDPDTGVINFTPATKDIGDHVVNITVTDGNGTEDWVLVDLTVENVNDAPTVMLYLPTDGFVVTVKKIKLVWVGEDKDGDDLTYDLYLDSGSGSHLLGKGLKETEYMLDGLTNGTTYKWTVEASDGKLRSTRPDPFSFKAEIDEGGGGGGGGGGGNQSQPNQPPTVDLISPANRATVKTLEPTFTWKGYDPDNDDLTYEVYIYDKLGELLQKKVVTDTFLKSPSVLENDRIYFWTVIPYDGEEYGVCLSGQWYFTVNRTSQQESQDPIANVTVAPGTEVDVGTAMSFDASASHDPDGTITLYIWTLGDGTTHTGPTFTSIDHTFEEGGSYNVSLVIFDNDGRSAIWSQEVVVKAEAPPPPPPPPDDNGSGLTSEQLMWALLITALIVAFGMMAAFMAYRKLRYEKYEVDQIFLVYKDGRLLRHVDASGEEGAEGDHDEKQVLGGMLTAVQDFVKDSLRASKGKAQLDVLEYGDQKIVIERGSHTYLAAFITGNATKALRGRMKEALTTIEKEKGAELKGWDGDFDAFGDLDTSLAKLI